MLTEKMSADVEFYGQSVVMRQTTSTGLSSSQETTCLSEELNKLIYCSSCNSAEQVTTAFPKQSPNLFAFPHSLMGFPACRSELALLNFLMDCFKDTVGVRLVTRKVCRPQ